MTRRPPETLALGVALFGMSRSGTSAVAGAFVNAGFFAGREGDVLPPTASNVAGHYENLSILTTNEEVLSELGGWWYDPPDWDSQTAAAARIEPRLAGGVERLAREAGGRPLVVKDPRLVMLISLWSSVLDQSLHPVLVVRDPTEIAHSLFLRDGTPLPFGLAMWELHMTSALWYLHGRTATVARYAQMVEDPALAPSIVAAAAAHLDPSRAEAVAPGFAAVGLNRELRHNFADRQDHEELLSIRQAQLWELLRALPHGDQRIEAPEHLRRLAETARASVRAEEARVLSETDRHRLAGQLADSARVCAELERSLAEARNAREVDWTSRSWPIRPRLLLTRARRS